MMVNFPHVLQVVNLCSNLMMKTTDRNIPNNATVPENIRTVSKLMTFSQWHSARLWCPTLSGCSLAIFDVTLVLALSICHSCSGSRSATFVLALFSYSCSVTLNMPLLGPLGLLLLMCHLVQPLSTASHIEHTNSTLKATITSFLCVQFSFITASAKAARHC